MCDFEQRVDIFDIDLPEPEDLDLFRVQGKDLDGCLTRTEEQMVVTLIKLLEGVLDHSLIHFIGRGIAAIIVGIWRLPQLSVWLGNTGERNCAL